MANRYWVGGTGTWTTTTTNWSATSGGTAGASAPTAADSVFFNQAATYTVTMTGALTCLDITVSAGTVTFATGTTPTLAVTGSMSLLTGTVWSSTGTITFNATAGKTITTNGTTLNGAVTFSTAAGGWSLGSNLTVAATLTTTLTGGALTLNGFTLTTGLFATDGALARSIAFGSTNIVLNAASGTVLSAAVLGGFTYTGTGGFTADASAGRTYSVGSTSGGTATNAPNLSFTGSGTTFSVLTTGSWFNTLNFGTTAFFVSQFAATTVNLNSLSLSTSGNFSQLTATMRGTGTITPNGNTTLNALTIDSTAGTTTLAGALSVVTTLTSGTLALAGFTLSTGAFNSSNSNTRAIQFGTGNIVLGAGYTGTVLNMSTATGFTLTGTGGFTADASATRTFTFGAVAGGSATNSPNLTLTGSGTAVQTFNGGSWFNTLNFGTTAFTIPTSGTVLNLNSLTLSGSGNFSNLTASMRSTGTITSNENTTLAFLIIDSIAGTTTLAANLTTNISVTTTTTLTSGTLNLNGFTLTTGLFISSNTNTRSITFGTSNIILSYINPASYILIMGDATGFTYTGTGGFVTDAAIDRQVAFGSTAGGSATNAPNVTLTGSGTAALTFTTGGWFKTLNFGTTAFALGTTALSITGDLILSGAVGATYTGLTATMVGTGTITSNGKTISTLTINSTSGTTTLGDAFTLTATSTTTLTSGTLALANFTLTTGIFSSSGAVTRSISFGTGNIVLVHTTAATTVLNMAIVTGFTVSGTGGFQAAADITRTYTLGTTGGSFTNAPNLELTGSGTAVQTFTPNSWFNKLNFNSTVFAIPATTLNLTSLVLSSSGTFTSLTAFMRGDGTVTSNGNTTLGPLVIQPSAGTTTLVSALACTTFTAQGNIDFATFNLTCSSTAAYSSGTLSNIGTITCTTWTCGGTFTLSSGTITPSTSFVVTGGFNYNGGTLSAVPTFTQTSGAVTLSQVYALTATGTYTLTAGTLTLNGFDLTTGIFSSTGTATRSIAFGIGNIVLVHTTPTVTVLSMATTTGFTWTGIGGFTTDAATVNRAVSFGSASGGTSANAPNMTITGTGASVISFISGSWFNKLDFGTTAFIIATTTLNLNALTLSASGTFTALTATMVGTGAITSNGNTTLAILTINSTAGTTTLGAALTLAATATTTLTSGTLALNGFNLTTGRFVSTGSTARLIAFGTNNIELAHTTVGQTVLSMADARNFTCTGTGGFTTTMSVTRSFQFGPLGALTTNAPNLSITSGASVPGFFDGSWFKTLDFTGSTCTPTTGTSAGLNVDTLILATGGTYTSFIPVFTRSQTWTPQFSKQLAGIGFNAAGGTFTPGGAQTYIANMTTVLTAGTLDLGGSDWTTGIFSSSGTGVRSIAFGTNNIILNHTTAATTVLSMATATNFTYTGTGGFTADASIARTFTFGADPSTGVQSGATETNGPNISFTGSGSATITFGTTSSFRKVDFGTTACSVTGTISTSIYANSFTLSSSGTYTLLGIILNGAGGTIITNGKVFGGLSTASSTVGTFTLGDAITLGNTKTFSHYGGNLVLNGFTLTVGAVNTSGTTVRSINFGTAGIGAGESNIVLTHTTAGTAVLSVPDATNFTCTGTGGFQTDAAITRTLQFGVGLSTTAPNIILTGSGTAVLTFPSGSYFNNLNFGTTAFVVPTTALYLGSLTLSSGGTFTNLSPVFNKSQTWTSQFGKQLGGIGCNIPGGTLTFGSSQSLVATAYTSLTAGTLDLGGYDLTVGTFNSSGTTTRAIVFGTNNIVLAHTTAAQTVLDMSTATGFTWTGTGGFTTTMSVTRTFTFGITSGSAINAPNLTLSSGVAIATLSTGSWFNILNFGTTAFTLAATTLNLNSLTLSSGGTFTSLTASMRGTGTITSNTKTISALTINSTSGTTTLGDQLAFALATATTTLTSGTLNLNGFDLTTGIFSSSNSNTRAIAFGTNNIVLAHTTSAQTVLDIGTATGFTYTGTGGFTTTMSTTRTLVFGTTGGSATNAPNLTLSSGVSIATLSTGSWFNTLDFGSTGFTIAATTLNLNSLTLSSGATYTNLTATMRGTGSINVNGKTIAALTINSTAGTTTLAAAMSLVATGTTTLTSGTLALADFTLTTGIFSSSNSNTRSIAFGTGNIALAHTTSAQTVLSMATATGFTYTGTGGFTTTMPRTRTFVFGTTGGSATNSPNLTLSSGSSIATFTSGSWFNKLDFGTCAFTVPATSLNLNGLTVPVTGTYTGMDVTMRGTGTVYLPLSLPLGNFTVNNGAGTTTIVANSAEPSFSTTSFTMTAGTIDFAGSRILTGGAITYTSGTWLNYTFVHYCSTFTVNGPFTLDQGGFQTTVGITINASFNWNAGSLTTSTFTQTSGTVTLGQSRSFPVIYNTAYTLTAGTLNLNGYNLTTGIFSSNNTNTRSIDFGTGNIVLAHGNPAQTVLSMATATGFTYTGTGGFTTTMSTTRTLVFGTTGGSITNAPNLTLSGTEIPTFIDGSWFNALNFTGSTGTPAMSASLLGINIDTLTLATGGTYTSFIPVFTRTQTWTPQFSKQLGGIGCNIIGGTLTLENTQTYTATSVTVLIAGTLDLGGYNLTTGSFGSIGTDTRSIAFGTNNIVLAHTSAAQTVLDIGTATGFTYTGTGGFTSIMSVTRTFRFGMTGGSSTNAPGLTLTSGVSIATITTGSWFNTLDFGTTAFAIAATTLNLNSLTLSSGGTYTNLTATMRGTGSINTNGKTIAALTINSTAGTTTLAAALSLVATGTTTLTSGTLALANFTLTTGIFSSSGSLPRSIAFGTGNITLTHSTAATTVLSMSNADNFTSTGTGGFTAAADVTRTYTYGTSTTASSSNGSIFFNGTSQYLNTATNLTFNLSASDFTVEAWIYTTQVSGFQAIIAKNQGTYPGGFEWNLQLTNTNALVFNGYGSSYFEVISSATIPIGNWIHVAAVRNGATITIYINGVASGTVAAQTLQTTASQVSVARDLENNGGGRYFAGYISNVRVVKGVAVYTGNFTVPTSNLTSTQNAGTNISAITGVQTSLLLNTPYGASYLTDSSSYGIVVTNINAAASLSVTPFTLTTNGSILFNGTSQYLTATKSGGWLSGDHTVEAWVYMNGFDSPVSCIAGESNGGASSGFEWNINATSISVGYRLGPLIVISATMSFSLSTWYHVAVSRSGTTVRLFVDGAQVASGTASGSTSYNILSIGYLVSGFNYRFNGYISNFRLVNGVAVYTGNFTVPTTNLTSTQSAGTNISAITGVQTSLLLNTPYGASYLTDSSSYVNTVTNVGAATSQSVIPFTLGSISFNGTSQYLNTATNAALSFGTSDFTVEMWVNNSSRSTNLGTLYDTRPAANPGTTVYQTIGISTTGVLTYTAGGVSVTGGTVPLNVWTHIAVVRASDLINIYINGVLTNTPTSNTTNLSAGASRPTIGTDGNVPLSSGYSFIGSISNLRVVKGVAVYTGTFTVPSTNLTSTQSAGTNISAITGVQTSLLLNTPNSASYLTDSSSYGIVVTNTGAAAVQSVVSFLYAAPAQFINLTFGSGSSVATITTNSYFNVLNFGSTTFTIPSTNLNLNSLILSTGAGVYTNLVPTMVGTGSINTNGKSLTTLTINHSGITTLSSAVTTTTSTTLTSGTLALSSYTLTPTQFISGTAATRAISSAGVGIGIISLSNDWTVTDGTGFTGSDYTIFMTKATAKTFAGAGGSYGVLVQAGAGTLTISGSNSLADIQTTVRPSTISFTAGSTQTVSAFTLAGTAGNLVTINSVTPGSQFTLSQVSGTVTASYLSIQDSNATGGATWNAYNGTNTNVSNNTGWLFSEASGSGNFMAFFF